MDKNLNSSKLSLEKNILFDVRKLKLSKKNVFKVCLVVFTSLFLFLSVFLFLKTQISEKAVRKDINNQIKKIFPNTKFEVGKISLSYGSHLKVKIENLNFFDQGQNNKNEIILGLNNVKAKIAWRSVILSKGKVFINIEEANLFILQIQKISVWPELIKKFQLNNNYSGVKTTNSENVLDDDPKGYVYNIKIDRANILWPEENEKGQNTTIENFVVKNIFGTGNAAFVFNMNHSRYLFNKEVSFTANLVGEFDFRHFIIQKGLPITFYTKVNNFRIDNEDVGGVVTINSKLIVGDNGTVQGTATGNYDTDNTLSFDFLMTEDRFVLNDIQANVFVSFILDKLKVRPYFLDITQDVVTIDGSVERRLGTKSLMYDLSFATTQKIAFDYGGNKGKLLLRGTYSNDVKKAELVADVQEGKIEVISEVNSEDDQSIKMTIDAEKFALDETKSSLFDFCKGLDEEIVRDYFECRYLMLIKDYVASYGIKGNFSLDGIETEEDTYTGQGYFFFKDVDNFSVSAVKIASHKNSGSVDLDYEKILADGKKPLYNTKASLNNFQVNKYLSQIFDGFFVRRGSVTGEMSSKYIVNKAKKNVKLPKGVIASTAEETSNSSQVDFNLRVVNGEYADGIVVIDPSFASYSFDVFAKLAVKGSVVNDTWRIENFLQQDKKDNYEARGKFSFNANFNEKIPLPINVKEKRIAAGAVGVQAKFIMQDGVVFVKKSKNIEK